MNRYARSHFAAATLFASARQHAGLEIASMADLLADLAEIDAHKHYLPAGYQSMKAYCLAELPFTADEAGNRIRAARVAREYPMIFPMLSDGRLLLTGVLRLAPCLTPENADGLLAAAAHKTKPELEALLAERFPRSEMFSWTEGPVVDCEKNHEGVPERVENSGEAGSMARTATVKRLSAQSLRVQFTMSQEEYALVRRSHELRPAGDDKEVFMRALKAHVAQMEKRKYAATDQPTRSLRQSRNARTIPAPVRRAVRQRDGDRCAFVSNTGKRCTAREHLQFDHLVPVARGGEATVSNLRLLCRAHNQHEAERVYGAEFMRHKRLTAAEERAADNAKAPTRSRELAAEEDPERSVVPWLRALGYSASEAKRAAEFCMDMPDATLEERVSRALALSCRIGRPAVPAGRACSGSVARRRELALDQGHTLRSTEGSARSAPRMNTQSGRTAGIQ